MSSKLSSCIIFCLLALSLSAQRQLLVVKGDRVVERFKVGDNFKTRLDGSSKRHWGFLVEVNEYSFITSQDTIMLSHVDKVLLPGKPFINKVGGTLVVIGLSYFLIDQVNNTLVHGNPVVLDEDVWKPALVIAGAGVPMLFFQKRWKKMGRKYKLISVGRDSKFYRPE